MSVEPPHTVEATVLKDATQALVDLWHPDRDAAGYHHPEIVAAACNLEQPSSVLAAIAIFYPGETIDHIPLEDREMIDRGYQMFQARAAFAKKLLEKRVKRTYRKKV